MILSSHSTRNAGKCLPRMSLECVVLRTALKRVCAAPSGLGWLCESCSQGVALGWYVVAPSGRGRGRGRIKRKNCRKNGAVHLSLCGKNPSRGCAAALRLRLLVLALAAFLYCNVAPLQAASEPKYEVAILN